MPGFAAPASAHPLTKPTAFAPTSAARACISIDVCGRTGKGIIAAPPGAAPLIADITTDIDAYAERAVEATDTEHKGQGGGWRWVRGRSSLALPGCL